MTDDVAFVLEPQTGVGLMSREGEHVGRAAGRCGCSSWRRGNRSWRGVGLYVDLSAAMRVGGVLRDGEILSLSLSFSLTPIRQ